MSDLDPRDPESARRLADFEKLSPVKQKLLLARLRRQEGGARAPIPPSSLRATDGPYPLSFAQQRLWFLDRLEPGDLSFVLADAVRLLGALDPAVLAAALSAIVGRHESLRTVFEVAGGRPVQRVLPASPLPLPLIDLAGLPAARREAEALRLARGEARIPFDVPRGPHLRARLLRLAAAPEAEHAALLAMHHVVSDGWSMGVLIRELGAFYAAFVAGDRAEAPAPLPALPIQYADFADWQRGWLAGPVLEEQLAWWRQALAGAPAVLDLPTDRPRPAVRRGEGASRAAVLPEPLVARLEALAGGGGATLFMALLAGYAALLSRHAGQDDLVIGSPIANRTRAETEGLIGFFVNTLVLRADLREAAGEVLTFGGLLDRVRKVTLGAYAHQDLPFERLVEELQPARDLSRTPLYQAAFALQNAPASDLALPGLHLEGMAVDSGAALADLGVEATRLGQGLALDWRFDVDLFEPVTALRLAGQFANLLAAATDPAGTSRPLAELPLLSAGERHQLLAEWAWSRQTAGRWEESPGLLHELFLARAAAAPGDPAIACGETVWTYGELAARAQVLARRLAVLGVGPEVAVALCLPRAPETVAALLAVLMAGGAYVPLDPAAPAARLGWMIADARAGLVLATRETAEKLPPAEAGPVPVLLLEELLASAEPGAERLSAAPALPRPAVSDLGGLDDLDGLAYVIYTSGSTGRPKGVAVPHRGVVNSMLAVGDLLGLGPGDRYLQFSSLAFDAAVFDVFTALTSGACLCLIPGETPALGAELAAEIERLAITATVLSPSVLATIPALPLPLPRLRILMAAAEKCPPELVRRWAPGRRFFNLYGPTEGSILCTGWEAGPSPSLLPSPPVGRPIANARIHLLDRAGRPVPAGAVGELHLGGPGVARGYLGRPALTAERFRPDPFAASPGERVYSTGDLARFLADGEIDLVGRADQQLKVRGLRIEPGEVEAVLAEHPEVDRAAVGSLAAAADPAGAPRLVAWVVPRAERAHEGSGLESALRDHLRRRLPEGMVPAAFVFLDSLPLAASGKLDRAALPAPDALRPDLAAAFEPPGRGLESAVAAVWSEVLKRERVGREDGFFDLGGHSLLLVEVQAKLRERLGEEVSLLELFRHPTVAALARHLAARQGREGGESDPLGTGAGAAEHAPSTPDLARQPTRTLGREIAIVGMAGRFPGARDLDELWRNLQGGVESISFFSAAELAAAGAPPELLANPRHVPAGGVLADADLFDAAFFGIGPREAQLLDPQQRVFLECAAAALEDAGYGVERRRGRVGIFAGAGTSSYALQNLYAHPGGDAFEITLGNDKDFLATRAAHRLDLKGPALTVQTACSTSLVAVHLAVQSLLAGECEMALAGGVSIDFPQTAGYVYQEGGVASPDGHNRAFDARAGGTVGGNGVGVVVLKPLAAALADGDAIRAVLRGSALNNDGAGRIGFTAPTEEGQAAVIAAAQAAAGVAPATIGLVEAHGSATALGDPIEVSALTRAFRSGPAPALARGFCALGSIKTNIGHNGSAAGIAGLLKAVLALAHGEIPPSLHFETPNPAIDLAASPFYVPTKTAPWPRVGDTPRRAGVSSFGLGGTNVHVVLEEAPPIPMEPIETTGPERSWRLLSLSARTATALEAATDRLADWLEAHPGEPLGDVAFTLHAGRKGWEHRRMLVASDGLDAASALRRRDPTRLLGSTLPRPEGDGAGRPVAYVLAGVGEQYPGLAAGLYETEPAFREELDRCAEELQPLLGTDVRKVLFARGIGTAAAAAGGTDLRSMLRGSPAPEPTELDRTELLQPALFAVEWALARLWMEWGVAPRALLGYSLGEYVAAALAGVFSLPDTLRLVAERARLVGELPAGAMLAAPLPEDELYPLLGPDLDVAAVNGPNLTVAAGPPAAVDELAARLAELGLPSRRLRSDHAFHSRRMVPAAARLTELARRLSPRPPRIPYLSNVTGTWITAAQATDPGYWAEHLCRTVRFADGLRELWRQPDQVLLELGPGQSLSTLALQHPAADGLPDPVAVGSLRSAYERQSDQTHLLATLGRLWLAGVEIDWPRVYGRERRRRLALPTYPFEGRRYWIEREGEDRAAIATGSAGDAARADDRVALPAWHRAVPEPVRGEELAAAGERWLVFALAGEPLGAALAARLRAAGAAVDTVMPDDGFAALGAHSFAVDPRRREDYDELLWTLGPPLPSRILHLWSAGPPAADFAAAQELGFYSLLYLLQTLAARVGPAPETATGDAADVASDTAALGILVVASGLAAVTGADPLDVSRSPLAALLDLLPREVPGALGRLVDLAAAPPPASPREAALVDALLADFPRRADEPAVAYRGGERWTAGLDPVPDRSPRSPAGDAVLLVGPEGGLLTDLAPHLQSLGLRVATAADVDVADATEDAGALRASLRRALSELELAPGGPALALVDFTPELPSHPLALAAREELDALLGEAARHLDRLVAAVEEASPRAAFLFSSLASLAPAPGGVLAAAVQRMAEARCQERNRTGPLPWTAVVWDRSPAAAEDNAALLARLLRTAGPSRVAISHRGVAAALRAEDAAATAVAAVSGVARHARPNLRNPYVAPETEVERRVTELWGGLVGVEEVGLHDSFFDLGGDSLLATQLMVRLREAFGIKIEPPAFFADPTPAAIVAKVEERPGDAVDPDEINRLIQQLDELSPEEVERMLAERGIGS